MYNKTESAFFDLIALADRERVQSAVIAWLLSSKSKALTQEARIHAINGLFGCNIDCKKIEDITIEPYLEWKNIDIILVVKENSIIKSVLVVENKIKCGLHDNQLQRYEEQIKKRNIIKWQKCKDTEDYLLVETNEVNPHFSENTSFIYLTLLKQEDQGSWSNVTYERLYEVFENALSESQSDNSSYADFIIAKSYCMTLRELVDIANSSLSNPELIFDNDKHPYIKEHKLRHILQHYYFTKVKNEIEDNIKTHVKGHDCTMRIENGIHSDNAEFALDITQGEMVDKYLSFDDGKKGSFCISYQFPTFKIAIAKGYNDDNYIDNLKLLNERKLARNAGEDKNTIFDWYINIDNRKWRSVNCPKGNRPRMSISIKPEDLFDAKTSEKWGFKYKELDFQEVLEIGFKECYDTLLNMMRFFHCNS